MGFPDGPRRRALLRRVTSWPGGDALLTGDAVRPRLSDGRLRTVRVRLVRSQSAGLFDSIEPPGDRARLYALQCARNAGENVPKAAAERLEV